MILGLNEIDDDNITRAFDNHCWLVSSDIVWGNETDLDVCQGYSTIVDNDGQVVAQALPFTEMLLAYGKLELFSLLTKEYAAFTYPVKIISNVNVLALDKF